MSWSYALLLKPLLGLLVFAGFYAMVWLGVKAADLLRPHLPPDHWLTREFKRKNRGDGPAGTSNGVLDKRPLLGREPIE